MQMKINLSEVGAWLEGERVFVAQPWGWLSMPGYHLGDDAAIYHAGIESDGVDDDVKYIEDWASLKVFFCDHACKHLRELISWVLGSKQDSDLSIHRQVTQINSPQQNMDTL